MGKLGKFWKIMKNKKVLMLSKDISFIEKNNYLNQAPVQIKQLEKVMLIAWTCCD